MIHTEAFEIVRQSYRNGRMPHAYIICGSPRGSGLRLAEDIAALLLCTAEAAERPCRHCDACQNTLKHKHVDTLFIEPEKKSRVISVEVMRDILLPWEAKGSYAGGWKICVLLFADRLNESSANAILKTLEEPSEQTLYLLITERAETLLPTIISRCQRLDLNEGRVPPAEPWRGKVGEILASHVNTSSLGVYATAGKMVALFEEIDDLAEAESKQQKRDSEFKEDADTVKAWISVRAKEKRQAVYESIRDWYRDVMVLSACEGKTGDASLFFEEHRVALTKKAQKVPPMRAMKFMEYVDKLELYIEVRNMRPSVVFPYWFAYLK